MENLNLKEDSKSEAKEKDYNNNEEGESIDSEVHQEELLDEVIELKANAVSKETDMLVKKALYSAGITTGTKLSPAS